jgi:hypothetical protein
MPSFLFSHKENRLKDTLFTVRLFEAKEWLTSDLKELGGRGRIQPLGLQTLNCSGPSASQTKW